jgi:uncharacterized protein YndB with AHSA1/START domain
MIEGIESLYMERTFQAPAATVFEAWTSEEVLRRWFAGQPGFDTPEASVDLRVGGTVRVVMRDPEKEVEHGGEGRYTAVEPPRRLAFTWTWDRDRSEGPETLIEIEFEEAGGGATTVRFRHSGLRDTESRRDHEDGWGHCFDHLEAALAGER